MTRYPILFGYRDLVVGNGFVASVHVSGRALIEEDNDGVWMIGINPGGFEAQGASHPLAAAAFREEYRIVLYDIASSTTDFATFQTMLQEFLQDAQPALIADWDQAVEAVRRNEVDPKGLRPRDSSNFKPSIRAVLLKSTNAKAEDNPFDEPEALAA